MFINTLNPLKGWPSPTALDFIGQVSSAVTLGTSPSTPLPAGRCVHVDSYVQSTYGPGATGGTQLGSNATNIFKTGVTGTMMGIFLFQYANDFDVANPGVVGSTTYWTPIIPGGNQMGLVATGAYELETTEYDTAQTYLPNQPLRALAADTGATGGTLTNQGFTFGTNAYVGVVSRGTYVNAYGQNVLAFWPVYAPTASA
jgi:hypothetical protein